MSSILGKFMKKLDDLPDSIKDNYSRIRELDEREAEKQAELQKICGSMTELQKVKKAPSNSQKRKYREALDLLDEIETIATEKLQMASESYETVDRYIIELDKAYGKFTQTKGVSIQGEKISHKPSSSSRKKKSRSNRHDEDSDGDVTEGSLNFDNPLVDMPVDPNEPTYCICHQVSFGRMVMCDNKTCTIEWFHFQCVGLTAPPKGKWYCSNCKEKMTKKKKSVDEK